MKINPYESWIGIGIEGGGTVVIPGIEYVGGRLRNLGMWYDNADFQILKIRMGLGIGGGVGMAAFFLFNCLNLWQIHGTPIEAWSFDVNVAMGQKWSSIVKSLRFRKLIPVLRLLANKKRLLSPDQISLIRDFMSSIYATYEIYNEKGPKLLSIEIPAAGIGAELSAHFTLGGDIEILN